MCVCVGGWMLKNYIFKAQYKSGGDLLAADTKLDCIWIRKEELKNFIKKTALLDTLNNCILDF